MVTARESRSKVAVRELVIRMARNMLPSLIVNAIFPALVYVYLRRLYPDPNVLPIAVAALFPVLGNLWTFARTRSLDTMGVIMVCGFGITLVTIAVTGDPRLILVSKSFLTFGMGLLSVLSLLLPKPISFYFARQFIAGTNADRINEFNRYWQLPFARRVARTTSLIWGIALMVEFGFRALIVYTLPVAEVLVLTPIVFNAISMSVMGWTVWYGNRAIRRIRRDETILQGVPSRAS